MNPLREAGLRNSGILVSLVRVLHIALLFSLLVAVVQMSIFLGHISEAGFRVETEFHQIAQKSQDTLVYGQAVLSSARSTLETVRKSAMVQAGYYEAVARRSATVLGKLTLLTERTDERMERLAAEAERTLISAAETTRQLNRQLEQLGSEGTRLLMESSETVKTLRGMAEDESITASTQNLENSSENLADAMESADEAMGYVRDMLSPTRKGFWRLLLEWMLPWPTVHVP